MEENLIENENLNENDVKEPDNIEAIIEGLLYVVGEDGIKASMLSEVIEKSLEDTKVYLDNIENKYKSEIYGIELVNYGGVYKFLSKKSV